MNTWPLALMRPNTCVGLGSNTRFKMTDCALGCTNCTLAWLPMLKLPQSMMARWLLWLTTMLAAVAMALWLMLACPPTTCPLVGSCWIDGAGGIGGGWAARLDMTNKLMATPGSTPAKVMALAALPLPPLLAVRAVSGTGFHCSVVPDHSSR